MHGATIKKINYTVYKAFQYFVKSKTNFNSQVFM